MVLSFELGETVMGSPILNGLMLAAVAALMVSKVPTLAMKRAKIPPGYAGFVLLGVGTFFAFLISTPWITLSVSALAYLVSIPYSALLYRRYERQNPLAPPLDDEDDDAGP